MNSKFVTAINCMDGRVQEPIIKKLKEDYNAQYVDMITEPGPNLILAENENQELINSIKNRVDISVNKHKSDLIAITGHYDCAGNPESKSKQIEDIKKSLATIKNWDFDVEVIGFWINKDWEVEKI